MAQLADTTARSLPFPAEMLRFLRAPDRRWCENLRRDARIAVAVAVDDGHDWVGFRGTAAFLDDGERAQQDIAAMARAYHRDEPGKAEDLIAREFRHQRRVSFVLTPADVHVEIGDQ